MLASTLRTLGTFPSSSKTRTRAAEQLAKIKGIFETIRNYKVPVVQLERDNGVESICRVFETINSTGTRLGTFDLAVARFYPNPDLRSMWEESQERWPILASFAVDGDRVLQVMYLMFTARERRYADPSRGNLLSLKPEIVRQEWQNASESLAEALKWARGQGARAADASEHQHRDGDGWGVEDARGAQRLAGLGLHPSLVLQQVTASGALLRQATIVSAKTSRHCIDSSKEKANQTCPPFNCRSTPCRVFGIRMFATKLWLNVLAMTVREDLITGERFDTAEPRFGAVNSEATGWA